MIYALLHQGVIAVAADDPAQQSGLEPASFAAAWEAGQRLPREAIAAEALEQECNAV